ncbi:MAG: CHAD domain-containing protein [Alphaproteobacteria bacterium]|nr:CHAD domain-containing protein [Alphaproteobacteria bacterium]
MRRVQLPDLPQGITVEEGFVRIAAGMVRAIEANIPAALDGTRPEGIHQTRVAIRRLRSALALFANALGPDSVARLRAELKWLAASLGPARDWDVFVTETLPAVQAALEHDPRLERLHAPAEAARKAAYRRARAALTGRRAARLLGALKGAGERRPWRRHLQGEGLALLDAPLASFALDTLDGRLKRVRKLGRKFDERRIEELHLLRLRAKRLRYAAEFFAPLFPDHAPRKFLRRIAALQDALGHMQDAATAEALLATIAASARERDMHWALGAVRGFLAGRGAREFARAAWDAFRARDPFWR